jgi:hypothetical protein
MCKMFNTDKFVNMKRQQIRKEIVVLVSTLCSGRGGVGSKRRKSKI